MPTAVKVNRSMTHLEWGLLLTLSVLWGGSFFFNAVAVRELPTLTIVVSRTALAALILWIALKLSGARMPCSNRVWAAFFAMGLLNNVVPFSLIVWGQSHIASGVASILNATAPLFTVVVAHMLTRDERMTAGRLAGVLVGLIGVAVMIGADAVKSLGVNVVADVACLAAAVSYAFAGVFGRSFKTMGVPPMATAAGQVTASSVLLLPFVLVVDKPWTLATPSAHALLALVGIAALSTALAYVLYFRILATAGATNLLLVTFLIPVSAILLGVLVLGESLAPKHLVGMAMIGLGLAAIDGRPWAALHRRSRRAFSLENIRSAMGSDEKVDHIG
jgi:drug/metabolite transporter (DMT)-like permease